MVSYDAMDTEETVGVEAIQDMSSPSMEELAIAKELNERLHHAVAALPKAERDLIRAIYFEGQTEEDYGKKTGLSQTGISYRRRKILSKLKCFWTLWEVFANFCYGCL